MDVIKPVSNHLPRTRASFLPLLLAGIIGGSVVLAANRFFTPQTNVSRSLGSNTDGGSSANNPFRLASNYGNSGGKPTFDFSEAAERTMPAVVHIKSTARSTARYSSREEQMLDYMFGGGGGGYREGTGSGVIIRKDGYIVTNNHVIEGATDLEVTTFDKRKFKATIVGTDPATDLAVIKVESESLPVLDIANSDEVRVGEWVLAVGNPFNLTSTVTAGIVSAKGRNIDIIEGQQKRNGGGYAIEAFIQTDAAVNPGNSGGALVNTDGKLVGINTAIASQTGSYAGYAFAIPANLVKKIVGDIIEFGAPQRGQLGINIQNMDSDFAKEIGSALTEGVYVAQVQKGSAAEDAGVQSGDIITGVNGKRVIADPDLKEMVARGRPGEQVTLNINRKGAQKDVAVKLKRVGN